MVFDEHDVVNGFLYDERALEFALVDMTRGGHNFAESVIQAVEVAFELT